MMRRVAGFLLLVLLFGWWPASLVAAGERVVAVIPKDAPPTYFRDTKTGKAAGFAVEVMDLVARRAGLEVEYRFALEWTSIIAQVERGEADLIPAMGISDERQRVLDFTAPVDVFPVVFFVREESGWTPDQLQQRHVGVVRGSVAYEHLKQRSHLTLESYPGFTEGLFDLLAGNIDAFACPQPTFLRLAQETGVAERIKVVGGPITIIKRAIAVRKGNAELLGKLNTAVAGLTVEPEYQRIYAKWYAEPEPFWSVSRISKLAGGMMLVAMLLMGVWHYVAVVRMNRRLAETSARHEEAEQALQLFRELVYESRDALFVIEPQSSHILDVNARACESLGFSCEELLAMNITDVEATLPDTFSWQQHVAEVKKTGGLLLEGSHRRKDGKVFPVENNVRYVVHGGKEYLVAIVRDITERQQTEAEREKHRSEFKNLHGMLPICSACKKIRDAQGDWTQIEAYIHRHAQVEFTHSICPECVEVLYPELAERFLAGKKTPSSG